MKKSDAQIVTPFDWRRYTAMEADASGQGQRRQAPRRAKPVSTRERIERILAHRWGNPYCKPGAA